MSGEAAGPNDVCTCGRAKHCGHDVCTACAWERGWQEVRVVKPGDRAYGCYAGVLRERMGSCVDYLGRISRVLRRGGDRRYVAGRAMDLRDAAGALVATCHDVEGWLGACGATIERHEGEGHWSEECALEWGHAGECDSDPPRSAVERARDGAVEVAEAAAELADVLRWMVWDRGRAEHPEELGELGRMQARLVRLIEDLWVGLGVLRLGPGRREASAPVLEAGGCEEELVCWDCEFVAASVEHLEEHRRERGH